MSQGGANSNTGSGGSGIEKITGNSGGAVGPDGAFNIDVLGSNSTGIDTVGTPASNLITIIGLSSSTTQVGTTAYATAVETGELSLTTKAITPDGLKPSLVSRFVVDPDGPYTTIQSALDAANAEGGGLVFVRNGTYTEDLTCYPDITVTAPAITSGYPGTPSAVVISGNHTPPSTGMMTFNNITFITTSGDTFTSAAAGAGELNFTNSGCGVTNGYFLNVPNWTGIISFWDFNPGLGTNDGGIYNPTGGASVYCYEAGVGFGSTQTMELSGTVIFNQGEIMCPLNLNTGADCDFANSIFGGTFTLSDDSVVRLHHGYFHTGATPCIDMNSSGDSFFANCVFDSSNNPAIDGSGAGTLTLTNSSFLDNAALAGTLTLGSTSVYPVDLANGELLIGSTGQPAVASTLTAGSNISISNGAGSITISANGGGVLSITSLDNTDSPYTVLSTDEYLSCDVSGGVLTIDLPDAPTTGRVVIVKDSTGSAAASNITVTTVGGVVTLDGATSVTMNTAYEALQFIFNGTSYEVF